MYSKINKPTLIIYSFSLIIESTNIEIYRDLEN